MSKEMNVVMLPNEKASDLFIGKTYGKLHYKNNTPDEDCKSYQHLYIVSDNKIKKGDWFIWNNKLIKCKYIIGTKNDYSIYDKKDKEYFTFNCKKIEATTDTFIDVSKEDKPFKNWKLLPQIPQSFIEEFVKLNGTIKKVNVIINPDGTITINSII